METKRVYTDRENWKSTVCRVLMNDVGLQNVTDAYLESIAERYYIEA